MTMPPSANDPETPTLSPATGEQINCLTLFLVFSRLALSGFGGVLPFAYRGLVERRKWLTPVEFAEILGICQVLPGPSICSVALMIGTRFAGTAGAFSALAGLIIGPFFIIIALGVLYQRYGNFMLFRNALHGMSAVAAGLILATAVKMAIGLYKKNGLRSQRAFFQVLLLIGAFVGVGLLRWQLIYVFCLLVPLGVFVLYAMGEKK